MGEKWQVAVRRKRHPGGLGGIIPVVIALIKVQKSRMDDCVGEVWPAGNLDFSAVKATPARQPLAPRAVVPQASQLPQSKDCIKPLSTAHTFIAKLLARTSAWPQVADVVMAWSRSG